MRIQVILVLVLTLVALRGRASATVLLPADFATSVSEAGLIVHGRVIDVQSTLSGPHRVIESVITVTVVQSIKGSAASTVSFRVPNGQVGRYRRIVIGAPEFATGDEVVVFLRGRPPALPTLYGLSQGVYRVRRGGAARPIVVPPPISAPGTALDRFPRGDHARRPMPVDVFAGEIRAILERTAR
jgi:hypothetical protein